MKKPPIKRIDLKTDEVTALLELARASMDPEAYEKIEALVQMAVYLLEVVEGKKMAIGRLQKLLFGPSSEKSEDVLKRSEDGAASTQGSDQKQAPETKPRKGHGRRGADEYRGAEKIPVSHASLQAGDSCPECNKGKLYETKRPGVLVRVVGQAPIGAKLYELQKLRCNLCGKVFTAQRPEGVGSQKYDATAASMIALLKYGSGLPFNRLEGLQMNLQIPLPASTQWDIVEDAAKMIEPVYDELIRQAAQGEVLHNDDTTMKILEFMGKRAKAKALAEDSSPCADSVSEGKGKSSPRKGVFTSGIVSICQERRIALFFTGRQHAGENLSRVLAHRATELGPPIQMCDALSRNLPKELKTILGNCLAHGRRNFVDVVDRFPEQCRYVIESLGQVYKYDAVAKEQNMSPERRLQFHQEYSGSVMKELKAWLNRQFEDRLVEPNSSLGQAISYMLRHWEKLTLFLRKAGAPLDNNICERALKKAILHRKNAMFYKTQNGANTGDLFMSLIYTCEFCQANPFDYITALQEHSDEIRDRAEHWMPWNYRDQLEVVR